MIVTPHARDRARAALGTGTTRRRFLAGGGSVALAGLLTACGGTSSSSPAGQASKAAGPWEFTDDRGKKAMRPQRPQRIVAQSSAAAALWEYGIRPVGVFGPQKLPDGRNDPQVGDVDLATVQSMGAEWGEFNIERYAALKPDLLVTTYRAGMLWYVPDESVAKVESIAPIVALQLDQKPLPEGIARYAAMAEALGADLDAPAVKKAKEDFEKASEGLRQVAKAKPGLKVLAVSTTKESVYITKPEFFGDLVYFRSLGLDFVQGAGTEDYWETLSWEQADKYPADLIMYDNRTASMALEQLQKIPTWNRLPAVQANQLTPWKAEAPVTYRAYTVLIQQLTDAVNKARTDVVA